MEWNDLLLWLSGTSAIVTLLRMTRARSRQSGWLIISALVLLAIGVTWLINPNYAGVVGGAVWGLLILLPSLVYRQILSRIVALQYDRAATMFSIVRWLHPFDGWWQFPALYRAMAFAERGDTAGAIERLESLRSLRGMVGLAANLHFLRLERDWKGLITVAQEASQSGSAVLAGQAIPMYLRGLGEQGQIDAMIHVYEHFRPQLRPAAYVMLRAATRWTVLAFAGRREALQDILDHQYAGMSRDRHRYWLARADWAAGDLASASAEMTALAQSPDGGIAVAAKQMLENPPPPANVSPEASALLDKLEDEAHHDRQYAVSPLGYKSWAVVTWSLILANVAVFLIEIAQGGAENSETLMKLGAAEMYSVAAGEWWRIVTANFLHFGVAHVMLNMLGLRVLGPFVERYVGRWRFLVIYLASGIGAVGGVIWIMYMGWIESDFLVGASGAIMGLIGSTAAILLRGWVIDRAHVAKARFGAMALIVVAQAIFDHLTPQVSGSAHLIGVGVGFVITLPLMIGLPTRPRRRAAFPVTMEKLAATPE